MAEDKAFRARQMRALTDDQRAESIAAADNVIGFERFTDRSKQVALREAYKKPVKPEGAA